MPTSKTRRKTGLIALAFHWFMILCTCGLWYPVYASRRRSRVTVTHVPAGYAAPPQPYGYGQPPAYGPQPGHYPPPQRPGPPPQQYGQTPPGQWGQPPR
jgi:hypothetical protein